MSKKILFLGLALSSSFAFAADNCSANVKGTDQMTYDVKSIAVPASCTKFTINLAHVGKMPKASMGHNVVIAKDSDVKKIAADGVKAGIAKNYVKPNDPRVIAHSKLIGGGEKTSVTFPVDKIKNGSYAAFCSFPAHETKMHIKLLVK